MPLRLLETWGGAADWNMAVDAWLLATPTAADDVTLRLYTWEPPALSLGYFQRVADVPAAAGRTPGVDLVRRTTGGGAIHHAHELTFSIAASLEHPLYRGPVADSYRRVHALIAEALAEFGVGATPRADRTAASDRSGTGLCFHASHPLDLGWDTGDGWRKGVGSAQRRKDGRVLHHGSIKLAADPLEPGVGVVQSAPAPDRLGRALSAALERGTGLETRSDELSNADLEQVEAGYRLPFSDPAHTGRR